MLPYRHKYYGLYDKKQIQSALRGDNELKELYIKYDRDEKAKARKGSNRSWTHYFKDLITGWVVEDLSIEMFRRQGVNIEHNGNDKSRVIDIDDNVSQEPDCLVTVGNIRRKLELTNEFNNIVSEKGYIEKRSPAIYRLWKEKAIWIYRELMSGKYILIDFATEDVRVKLLRHEKWDKDVHRYVLEENRKRLRDDRLLVAELIAVVGCGIEGKEQPKLKEVIDEDSPSQDWDIGGKRRLNLEKKETKDKKDENGVVQKENQEKKIDTKAFNGENQKKEQQPPPPQPKVQDVEDPDMMFDSSAEADDGETDWNAVAMANSQDIDF